MEIGGKADLKESQRRRPNVRASGRSNQLFVGCAAVLGLLFSTVTTEPPAAADKSAAARVALWSSNAGTSQAAGRSAAATAAAPAVPRYDHVVVVIMENHSAENIIANPAAPYLNSLAAGGASMTQSYGITQPASRTTWRCSPARRRASSTTRAWARTRRTTWGPS